MRPAGLSQRDTVSRELMDEPDCDADLLARTYQHFSTVNRLVSAWRRIYLRRIRPRLHAERPTSLLDIGFGGGDIPRAIAAWAARDGLALAITAIDPDERAMSHVCARHDAGVRFEQATSADLVARGERYDLVTSNHLLHHLDATALGSILEDSTTLCRQLIIHNDLARGRIGYGVYAAATLPLSGRSFVRHDGLLSIRRSYRRDELQAIVPSGWRVETTFPQRLLLTHEGGDR